MSQFFRHSIDRFDFGISLGFKEIILLAIHQQTIILSIYGIVGESIWPERAIFCRRPLPS